MAKKAKKTLQQEIQKQLVSSLDGLSKSADPKKLKKSIKKASKILSKGLKEKVAVVKKKVKKTTVEKPAAEANNQ